MKKTVNARGLACPQPVLLAKGAIAEADDVTVIVDNDTAVENIRRLATKSGCNFSVTPKEGGIWEVSLIRTGEASSTPSKRGAAADEVSGDAAPEKQKSPLVVVLSDNHMGRGDDTLGEVLIRAFMDTLLMLKPFPETIVCYNAGAKLAVKGSEVLEDLQQLEKAGVDILVCGTCLKHFGLIDQIGVGRISNMYDILETMAGAARLVRP